MDKNIFRGALIIALSFTIAACEKTAEPLQIAPSDGLSGVYAEYVQELDALIYPLNGAAPDLPDDDLQPLAYLAEAKIVGLGEATHGTKEFFQLKHRIFKYLVENHNFKVLGFECDMGESIYIDRYVCHSEGNIDSLMINKMHFWTWKTEEIRDLLEWMRTYNEDKTKEEKIHFIGFDCQHMTYQPALILDYFKNVKPEFIDEINPTLNIIMGMDNTSSLKVREYYKEMDEGEKQAISDGLENILIKLDDIEEELISKSSYFEYQRIRQLLKNIQQTNDVIFGNSHKEPLYRDKYMAENTVWFSTLFGGNTKIAIWAHNEHIANVKTDYIKEGSMGHHLKLELGKQYQIVGFSFSKGSFIAYNNNTGLGKQTINVNPPKGSLNYIFFNAKHNNFIFNLSNIPTDLELRKWICRPRSFLTIGATFNGHALSYYFDISIRYRYDAIINYDITSAAVRLTK